MDLRVSKTKKAIWKAYFTLLVQNTSEKISIAEIARVANINRKTFYHHYETVDDIVKDFAETKTREMLTRLTMRCFFTFKFDREILEKEAAAMLNEHLEFLRMISCNPNGRFFWVQVQDTTVQMLTEIYGRHTEMPRSDLKIQVSYVVAGAAAVLQYWLKGEIDCTLEEISDKVTTIAFTGVQNILRQA